MDIRNYIQCCDKIKWYFVTIGFVSKGYKVHNQLYMDSFPKLHTQSLESISHGLIFGHVDESSSQTEMGENEEDFLQDLVHSIQMLEGFIRR